MKRGIGTGVQLLLLVLALTFAACGAPAASTPAPAPAPPPAAKPGAPAPPATRPDPRPSDRVSITIPSQGVDFVYTAVADKRGFFAEEGLEVAFEQATATVGIPAVVAGQFDFTGSVGSAQAAIVQGAPLKIVLVAQDRPAYGFFARPGITAIPELKGKKLGITTIGSAAHIMANVVLAKHGLDPEQDVTWVALRTPQNLWVGLKADVVDAAMIGTADLHRPGKEGYVDLRVYKDPSVRNASVGLTTSDRLLREKPDTVKRMIRAGIKAIQFMKANKAATVPIMAEFLDIPPQEADELYDLTMDAYIPQGYADDETLRQSLDMLVVAMELKEPPPVTQVFDLRLAREADEELRREGWKP